ncbi:hypothetical protein BDW22DRAFT_1363056 [Trametopsis cervina]|nr:hypothetical protein BDW22DRAFT_1363056 [Trametopsis cervina]
MLVFRILMCTRCSRRKRQHPSLARLSCESCCSSSDRQFVYVSHKTEADLNHCRRLSLYAATIVTALLLHHWSTATCPSPAGRAPLVLTNHKSGGRSMTGNDDSVPRDGRISQRSRGATRGCEIVSSDEDVHDVSMVCCHVSQSSSETMYTDLLARNGTLDVLSKDDWTADGGNHVGEIKSVRIAQSNFR